MELSIVVTHYKYPELLKVCLDSIKKSEGVSDFEIIVSDSETEEKTRLIMAENFPDIQYLPAKENIGYMGTINRGYEVSHGDYILFLNGDMVAKKDTVKKLLDFIKSHPDVGMVGPKLLNFNGTLQYSCFRFYTPLTILYRRTFLGKLPFAKKHSDRFLMKDKNLDETQEADQIMGAAMMIRKKAIEKIGLMDPRFTLYFEDVDWCWRFWENGFKIIYYPKAEIFHYHGRGSAKSNFVLAALVSNKLAWLHILSALKFFWKYKKNYWNIFKWNQNQEKPTWKKN